MALVHTQYSPKGTRRSIPKKRLKCAEKKPNCTAKVASHSPKRSRKGAKIAKQRRPKSAGEGPQRLWQSAAKAPERRRKDAGTTITDISQFYGKIQPYKGSEEPN